MSNNSQSKFLMYNVWTKIDLDGNTLSGSYLYDILLLTEEDAKQAVENAIREHEEFKKTNSYLVDPTDTARFIYIKNKPTWWT
jgi:hypothetical protein